MLKFCSNNLALCAERCNQEETTDQHKLEMKTCKKLKREIEVSDEIEIVTKPDMETETGATKQYSQRALAGKH